MAPQGKFKYSSAFQLASDGTAGHQFIHKQVSKAWMGLVLSITVSKYCMIGMTCSSAIVNTFAHSFHYRENMGVGEGK